MAAEGKALHRTTLGLEKHHLGFLRVSCAMWDVSHVGCEQNGQLLQLIHATYSWVDCCKMVSYHHPSSGFPYDLVSWVLPILWTVSAWISIEFSFQNHLPLKQMQGSSQLLWTPTFMTSWDTTRPHPMTSPWPPIWALKSPRQRWPHNLSLHRSC